MGYSLFTYKSVKKVKTVASHTDFTILFHKKMDKILDDAYIHHVDKKHYELEFKGIFFRFIWNGFNRFNGITKGNIKVEEIKGKLFINFKLYFHEIFILCSIFSLIPIIGFFDSILLRVLTGVIIWSVYIGNNVLAVNRIKGLFDIIEGEINEIPEYKKEIEFQKEIQKANNTEKKKLEKKEKQRDKFEKDLKKFSEEITEIFKK